MYNQQHLHPPVDSCSWRINFLIYDPLLEFIVLQNTQVGCIHSHMCTSTGICVHI